MALFEKDYTGMHGQQNIKFVNVICYLQVKLLRNNPARMWCMQFYSKCPVRLWAPRFNVRPDSHPYRVKNTSVA